MIYEQFCVVECVSIRNRYYIFQLSLVHSFSQVPEFSTIVDAPKAKKTALTNDDGAARGHPKAPDEPKGSQWLPKYQGTSQTATTLSPRARP